MGKRCISYAHSDRFGLRGNRISGGRKGLFRRETFGFAGKDFGDRHTDGGFALQKQHRLGRSRQFSYVYRRGAKASCREMTLLYIKNSQQRVGFSVSKKVGCAVMRNRTKRRLRECIRSVLPELRNGLYVVVAHPSAAERSYAQLQQSVYGLLKRMSLFRSEPPSLP